MSMRKYFTIFLFIFGVSTSFAQFPRIDSMVTEPYSDLFYIHGKFGDSLGKVIIDVTVMQIDTWSDSVIAVKLTGSFDNLKCGPVTVSVNGNTSNIRILSKGWIHAFTWNDSEFIHGSDDYYYWLYDFHSFFINHKGVSKLTIQITDSYYKLNFDFAEKKAKVNQLVMDLDQYYFLPSNGSYRPTFSEYPKIDYQTTESCGAPLDARTAFKNSIEANKVKNQPFFNFSAYPNPSSKELIINLILPEIHNTKILLYNLKGKIAKEQIVSRETGENRIMWDISDLPNGTYILGLITQKEQKSQIIEILH